MAVVTKGPVATAGSIFRRAKVMGSRAPTTAAMVMGDALVVALLTLKGFTRDDFATFHPSGVLGRSLLVRVEELMHRDGELPVVTTDMTLRETLPAADPDWRYR